MFIAKIHTLNWFATAMPKLSMTLNNGNTNIDVAALLKKNGILGDTKSSNTDTLEITVIRKETNTPTEAKNDAIELAKYVSRRNKEIRDSIPKPIPPEMGWAIVNADYPHKEEIECGHVLGAEARRIEAKMKRGKKLASEEMDFLREHFPEMYTTAKRIEREMEQFRKQLENCDTKEEQNRSILQKISQLVSVAKIDPEYVQFMIAAIIEELKLDIRSLLTDEQKKRLQTLVDMSDSEIDFSDIPKQTEERFACMRPFRDSICKQILT